MSEQPPLEPQGVFITAKEIYDQVVLIRERINRLESRVQDAVTKDIEDVETGYQALLLAIEKAAQDHEKRHRSLDVKFYGALAGLVMALGVAATGWPK